MRFMKQWIREGFSTYYVVEKNEEITYEKDILLNHSIDCLLPCEIRMLEDQEYYYFETGIYTPLFDKIDHINPREFFHKLFLQLKALEGYLLDLDHLQLEEDLLFIDEKQQPVLCYYPGQEKNIMDQVKDLVEVCMERITYDDKKKTRIYYEFHGFLTKQKPNIEQILNYLKPEEVQEEYTKEREEALDRFFETEPEPVVPERRLSPLSIFLIVLALPLGAIAAFFATRIFFFGLYGPFVIGFGIPSAGIGGIVFYLWKTYGDRNPKQLFVDSEEHTQLLSEEDKTVLLMELPMGKLRSLKEEGEITLGEGHFVIGSKEGSCDYHLDRVGISRRHAEFYMEDGKTYVKDLDSTNGTFVNGKRVSIVAVEDGDEVMLGREVFEYNI